VPRKPAIVYVEHLPDLMTTEDYETADTHQRIRIRLAVTDEGLQILADSPYPELLEEWLEQLDPEAIEMMLCG
jgi:FtsH ternary system-associated peptide